MMAQAIPNSGPGSGIPPGQGKTREDMPKAVSKEKENMAKTTDKDKRQREDGEYLLKQDIISYQQRDRYSNVKQCVGDHEPRVGEQVLVLPDLGQHHYGGGQTSEIRL